jgi:hypothetical protein
LIDKIIVKYLVKNQLIKMTQVYPKEYLYYKYTPELKNYARAVVRQHFSNIYIEVEDFLSYVKDLTSEQISKMIISRNMQVEQSYVELFYQMSLVYLIDRIKHEKLDKNDYTDSFQIKYNDMKATTPYGKFDSSWFPTGLYVLPKIISEKVANRLILLVYYLLKDNTQAVRFSLTQKDEPFGDQAPNTLYCIYKSIYDVLTQHFIMMFEKKKLLITSSVGFSMNKIDPMSDEIVFLFTRHVNITIGKKHKLYLPSGSIMVLNKEAVANTIQISGLENSIVFVFY